VLDHILYIHIYIPILVFKYCAAARKIASKYTSMFCFGFLLLIAS